MLSHCTADTDRREDGGGSGDRLCIMEGWLNKWAERRELHPSVLGMEEGWRVKSFVRPLRGRADLRCTASDSPSARPLFHKRLEKAAEEHGSGDTEWDASFRQTIQMFGPNVPTFYLLQPQDVFYNLSVTFCKDLSSFNILKCLTKY